MKLIILMLCLILPIVSQAETFKLKVGETCQYKVSMMGMNAGTIETKIEKEDKLDGKPVLVFREEIKTSGLAEKFYKLIQITSSYWSIEKQSSLKQEFDITENSRHKSGVETIDYEKKNYHYDKKDAEKTDIAIASDDNIQDFSSIAFYVRTIDWAGSDMVKKIKITDMGGINTIELRKVSEEKVNGKDSYKIAIKYESKKEDFFWLEKDGNRQLVRMKLKLNAGSLESNVQECKYN